VSTDPTDSEPDVEAATDDGYDAAASGHRIPPVTFNILVLSMNTSALIHLGDAPHPEGPSQLDLALARQTIDMLALLEDKTRGNLTGEEERLLGGVLFDLRLRFARKAGG
jgi:hypothetical protein